MAPETLGSEDVGRCCFEKKSQDALIAHFDHSFGDEYRFLLITRTSTETGKLFLFVTLHSLVFPTLTMGASNSRGVVPFNELFLLMGFRHA